MLAIACQQHADSWELCAALEMRMDDRNELRCLPTQADCSRPSRLSTNTSLVKREGPPKSRTLCAAPRAIWNDTVVVYFSRLGGPMYTHERVTLSVVAEAIAQIKGAE